MYTSEEGNTGRVLGFVVILVIHLLHDSQNNSTHLLFHTISVVQCSRATELDSSDSGSLMRCLSRC